MTQTSRGTGPVLSSLSNLWSAILGARGRALVRGDGYTPVLGLATNPVAQPPELQTLSLFEGDLGQAASGAPKCAGVWGRSSRLFDGGESWQT